MPFLPVGKQNSGSIDLYYEDYGTGRPIVLIHGWPLNGRSWERQIPALIDAGYRVVAYDRRGFGNSSRPADGYDYDTLTADLHAVLTGLDLHDATLVGFSMGGGEVARYFGRYGHERVKQAVFVSAVPPFLLKTADNPDGVDASVFDGIKAAITADRPAFLADFLLNFFNVDALRGSRISDRVVEANWLEAVTSSPIATLELVTSWSTTDFRADLARIDVPTLVVHGDSDRTVPIAVSGARTHAAVKGSTLVTIPDGPHGLTWTHANEFNSALLAFLA